MRSILAVFCIFFSIQSFAASNLIDSVGVENNNGKQVILHKVTPKESYYSIGRRYSVPPKDIIALNDNIPLQKGVVLKIPTQRPFSNTISQAAKSPAVNEAIEEYSVAPRESLFAISRKFGVTVEEIKKLNNLNSNSLSIGQKLKIPKKSAIEAPATRPAVETSAAVTVTTESAAEDTAIERPKIITGRLGVTERSERGVAVWIADENLDGTKMLALHRNAPVGTVIKITNPMTDRVTFAKVVGRFTENETTKDVIIVLTKATADLLGALDKRFQVNIDYGVPNE